MFAENGQGLADIALKGLNMQVGIVEQFEQGQNFLMFRKLENDLQMCSLTNMTLVYLK